MKFDPKTVCGLLTNASMAEGSFIAMAWIDDYTFMLNDENTDNLTYDVQDNCIEVTYTVSGDHVLTIKTKNDLDKFIDNMVHDTNTFYD